MIITLTGSNSFLIAQETKKLRESFVKKYGVLAVEQIDGEEAEYARLNEAVTNLPFLIEEKLVILRHPSKNKQFAENIEQIISSIPDSITALILEPKIDKRTAYFKTLKTKTEYKELVEMDNSGLAGWLAREAKDNGGNMSISDANFLVDRLGPNQQLLANELDKLLSYNKNITRENIELLTEATPQTSIFDLLDSAFSGNKQKTQKIYEEQRQQMVEPLEIMAMLAWQLKILAIIKTAGDKSPLQIASEAKLNPFVVRKSSGIAAKLTPVELKNLIDQALELDVRLKTESVDADEAMRHFLLSLSS